MNDEFLRIAFVVIVLYLFLERKKVRQPPHPACLLVTDLVVN